MYKTVRHGRCHAKSYLSGSVLVQKPLAKPLVSPIQDLDSPIQGERCQGTSAMRCLEEASQRYSGGCRAGLTVVRAATPMVKHVPPASGRLPKSLIRLLSSATRVLGGVTWRKWPLAHTGEVPRRLCSSCRVTPGYKARPKCLVYAAVRRRPP